jgi:hypothetical protein
VTSSLGIAGPSSAWLYADKCGAFRLLARAQRRSCYLVESCLWLQLADTDCLPELIL